MILCMVLAMLGAAGRAADTRSLVLDHLTPADGLPQSSVYASLQDSQGFIWLATEDGLVRFDGRELVRYAYSRTSSKSLPGNFIRDFAEDEAHDLWIAVKDAGLARYNRRTDDFTVFRHDARNPGTLASDTLRTLIIAADGKVWVGTSDAGVDVLDPRTGHIEHHRHDARDPSSLSDDAVFDLLRARDGSIWIATSGGLDRWQPSSKGFEHLRHAADRPSSLSSNQISTLMEDRSGSLWVGTLDAGINRLNARGEVLQRFRHTTDARSLSSDDVKAVLEDHAGHIWIGTAEGLDLLDPLHESITHYVHDESDAASLRDSYVLSLYEDNSGLVWIGTRDGGVSRWNPRSWELGGHRPPWLIGKPVTAFAESNDHRLWIASLGGGLKCFDPIGGDARDIDVTTGRLNSLGDSRIMALLSDRRGGLWIGTMWNGLKHLTPDGRLDSYPFKAGDAHGVSAQGIMTLFESRRGDIWVGTYGGGVNVVDADTGRIRQLAVNVSEPGSVSSPNVTSIAEDGRGNLWFGTDGGGLDLATPDGRIVAVFKNNPSDAQSLPSNTIYAITFDSDGDLWVGTDKGGLAHASANALVTLSPGLRFEILSREQGLSSDVIYAVLEDDRGYLWLSGNAGLMRLARTSRAIKTYHREHGAQGEEFDLNASLRLRDGRLAFGGPGGFNLFDPRQLTESTRAPRIALTRLEVLGAPLATNVPYWLLRSIELDHHASIVSLDFSALDFTSPKRNRLAYRIPGLSDQWIDLDSQRRVTLTNLDAGLHQLEVRAANADSLWSEPLRIAIHRAPSPWRSPWAYAAYAAALFLFVAHLIHRSRRKLRLVQQAKQQLETEVALRTRELRDSNQQLAEASQAKSNFLARMSHELRTPMNGVLGSTELLARTPLSAKQNRLIDTIGSSARVLLQIVNDLLDLSKIQAGKFVLETIPIDIVGILEESATLFAANAESKSVEIVIDPPADIQQVIEGDGLRLRQIIMNLIGNAVKFTPQGMITVKADLRRDGDVIWCAIRVSDTGIGMDEATIQKIFEPFTQADESTTRRFGGTGLGLAICRELAQRMGGSIEVTSRPNVGSEFLVTIPLQVSGECPPRESRTSDIPVLVWSHRPALTAALMRHLAATGVSSATQATPGVAGPSEIIVADAGSCEAEILACLRASDAPRSMIIIASDAELEKLRRGADPGAALIVPKPVHRSQLHQALAERLSDSSSPSVRPTQNPVTPQIGGRILLVEDEPVNAGVAQGYLSALGITSVWATSGAQAVSICASERFDLIMMDLNMPDMDGFATSRVIRNGDGPNARVPIIALTAHQGQGYRDAALLAGMNDMMSKPYSVAECARLLSQYLGSKQADMRPAQAAESARTAHSTGGASLSDIDRAIVASLRNLKGTGSTDLYATLTGLFLRSSRESIDQLQASVRSMDRAAIASVCHKLAAAAANVGASAFARHARELEAAAKDRHDARILALSTELIDSHPALCAELSHHTLKASA